MNKRHAATLKFHAWFTLILASICLIVVAFVPSISLFVALAFFVLYVAGNTALHLRHKTFSRDILIEYALVSIVALIVLVGAVSL